MRRLEPDTTPVFRADYRAGLAAGGAAVTITLSAGGTITGGFTQTITNGLSRTSRNQEGNASPSAVRANLDDPPIHIRPVCSRISGCEGKNRVGSSHYGTPTIAPRLRDRKGFLRSK